MGITRSTQRRFPFFKRELRVVLENLETAKTLKEILKEIPGLFNPEISNIFELDSKQTLINFRGRPEVQNGAEVGRELLLKVQGKAPGILNSERALFEATVETKFKEFSQGAIFYNSFSAIPEGFEFNGFSSLVTSTNVELTKIEVGLDYFETKEFPFLGMKLQGLKERFYAAFTSNNPSAGIRLNAVLENNNAQISTGFSSKMREKIGYLGQFTGIPNIAKEINE